MPVPGKQDFLVTHPEDLRRVMVTEQSSFKKSFDYQILARLVGQGLLTSEGEVWLRDRRLQQPPFHGRLLERFHQAIVRCAKVAVGQLGEGQEIRVDAEMTRFSLHVIGERIMSLDVRADADAITRHLDVCQRQIVNRALALVDVARVLPTIGEWRFRRALGALDGIIDRCLDARAALPGEPEDLYQILAHEPDYPRRRMRDQFVTLFSAGHETTGVALTWLFHLLAQHPEIEARCAEEAAEVVAGDVPTRAELDRLVYTRQALDESMRLYPPVGFMGRETLADVELGGYPIPKGAVVILCPYATQRRADLWPDPTRFDPDRFAPGSSFDRFAYIPFGHGPRGCIGAQFAMMEMLTLVPAILKRFRLVPTDSRPLRPVPLVSMRPNRPVPMRVAPAHRRSAARAG
jgi:cytochrome P450